MTSSESGSTSSARALVFSGGGARTAYQAGVLRYFGAAFPELPFPVVTAMGAGALNAGFLAGRRRSWPDAARSAADVWASIAPENIFQPRSLWDLIQQLVRQAPSARQSLLDPTPLRGLLQEELAADPDGALGGLIQNLEQGWLEAIAVTTTRYASLGTVTWAQGRDLEGWSPERHTARTARLTTDHFLAAGALPLLYPAVSINGQWHGAGVGLLHPAAPARCLGADRVLVLSTRAETEGTQEAEDAAYPSPLQIASILSNTLLLDTLPTNEALRERRNRRDARHRADEQTAASGDVLVLRPSVDPTSVAEAADPTIGEALGPVLEYLHEVGTPLPDLLSLLLFDPDYLHRLLLIGYTDARDQHDRIEHFLRR